MTSKGEDRAVAVSRRSFLKLLVCGIPAISAVRSVLAAGGSAGAIRFPVFGSDIEFMRRSAWSSHVAGGKSLAAAKGYSRITVHHQGAMVIQDTSVESVVSRISGVYETHMGLGYGDIGYHFIVDYAGRVWEGRSLSFVGAHVCGENNRNIGVMALGNFQKQKPSAKQVEATRNLIGILKSTYGIPSEDVYGHCDLGYTLCPGRYLYPAVVGAQRKESLIENSKRKAGE